MVFPVVLPNRPVIPAGSASTGLSGQSLVARKPQHREQGQKAVVVAVVVAAAAAAAAGKRQ